MNHSLNAFTNLFLCEKVLPLQRYHLLTSPETASDFDKLLYSVHILYFLKVNYLAWQVGVPSVSVCDY